MALPFENYQRFCEETTLGAAETTKTIKAAVSGVQYFVTSVIATCLTSAAQAVYVGDSSGTKKALSLAASFPAHSQAAVQLNEGVGLTISEALIIKPVAAGPSFHVIVEGYLKRSGAALV